MSPNIENQHVQSPPSDFLTRHEYGITKKRKHSSTGGGRAWSEQEENYLLQTRLQKMPYKHIAAHLKKTELACRLHYHQICHGPNRRRHLSISSTNSSLNSSPILPSQMDRSEVVNYVQEHRQQIHAFIRTPSMSPTNAYLPVQTHHQLASHIPILPKPTQQQAPLPAPRTLLPSQQPLRLITGVASPQEIDMNRLRHIYEAHLANFWVSVAKDYGQNVSAALLEMKWRQAHGIASPLTPRGSCSPGPGYQNCQSGVDNARAERERCEIGRLLGIDASPRSGEERERVRRREQGSS